MIVKLNKEQQATARRQVLSDLVWIITNDTLRVWYRKKITTLSPIELFLSARQLCDVVSNLPDITEGINYEMDDLEEESTGKNDAMIISVLAALQMEALNKKRVGTDFNKAITCIFDRYCEHELLFSLIQQWTRKEEKQWLEGKRTNLLDYEMQEIKLSGGGLKEVRQLINYIVSNAKAIGENAQRYFLLLLEKYNIEKGHVYDREILSLYDSLGMKTTPNMYVSGDLVLEKHVDTEVDHVASEGVGIYYNKN